MFSSARRLEYRDGVNFVVAVLCGLGLLIAQYFVGRGPYPFLALPSYAVLALAGMAGLGCVWKNGGVAPRWACVFFASALAVWTAVPLLERIDEWVPGLVVRQVLAALVVYGLLVFCITGSRERFVLIGILIAGAFVQAGLGLFQYLMPEVRPHLGWISVLCPDHMEMHAFRARGFYYNANHLAWLLNIAGAFALAAVVGTAWMAWSSSDLAQYRFLTAADEGYRVNVWKTALRLWQTEPLAGTGAGTFSLASRSLRFQADALDDIAAHNDWVQGLAELGMIGIGLALGVVVLHFAAGWGAFGGESRRRIPTGGGGGLRLAMQVGAMVALAACVGHSFFDFNMQVPANLLLLAAVLGILASPGRVGGERDKRIFFGRIGPVAVAGMGVLLALMVWRCHRAELAWILADKALRENKPARAEELAQGGLAENPVHARLADAGGRAWFNLAMQGGISDDERSRRLDESAVLFKKAADLDSGDAWNLLNLAHAVDIRQAGGGTAPLYFRAIQVAPFFAAPYEFYGLGLEKSGDFPEAIRFYGLATSLPGSTFSAERRKALMEMESHKNPAP